MAKPKKPSPKPVAKQQNPKKTGQGKRGRKGKGKRLEDRPLLEANAAGIDIGAREIFVAVPPDRDQSPVRIYKTQTEDLELLAQWLVVCQITTVAMESTGVYWSPIADVLEGYGLKVCVVDARGMKNVPGRRTDWHECQWIQYLHSVGLLRAAFRPEAAVRAVRTLMRHRTEQVLMANQHIQHMHKALTQMNVQLHHRIDDITGVTGMAIVDAIIGGERDAAVLAKLRMPNVKASEEEIRKSLEANWQDEYLFTLKQSRESLTHYQQQIAACDEEIEKLLVQFQPRVDPEKKPLPESRKSKPKGRKKQQQMKNPKTGFDMRQEAYKLFGVDLTQVPGLMLMVLTLFSEIGRDMSRWPTAGHFVSWLGLCPDNDITGGKVRWRGMRKVKSRAGTLFRLAAHSLHHEESAVGDYLRRMKSKLGPAGATTATAHKIAVIFYTMVKKQVEYDPTIWGQRDTHRVQRMEAKLQRQARQMGYQLVRVEEEPAA
jgi:transposase